MRQLRSQSDKDKTGANTVHKHLNLLLNMIISLGLFFKQDRQQHQL